MYKIIRCPDASSLAHAFWSGWPASFSLQPLGKPKDKVIKVKVKVLSLTKSYYESSIVQINGETTEENDVFACINVNEHSADYLSGTMKVELTQESEANTSESTS